MPIMNSVVAVLGYVVYPAVAVVASFALRQAVRSGKQALESAPTNSAS